ncbi:MULTISPECIES: hypothetical protein [unclassified Streptomyces]|uniref:hypothetical protein n=1 Tax=unclassified Streptomyces TaxID=2593676 RepID=UPI0036EA26E4
MIAVAVVLLPALGVLLYAMDRVEGWLSAGPPAARHARRRHLRLVHDAGSSVDEHSPSSRGTRHIEAA